MQLFGLISIIITVAIAGWWLSSSLGTQQSTVGENGGTSQYQDAIEQTRDVVDSIGEKVPVPTSGRSVAVYDGVSVNEYTRTLDLSGQGLSGSLKAEIRHLTKLQELNLSDNNFTGLPAEVGQLSQLEVLNLSNNPFTGLPYELGNLKNLKVLDLRGTQYAKSDLEVIKKGLPATTQILVD